MRAGVKWLVSGEVAVRGIRLGRFDRGVLEWAGIPALLLLVLLILPVAGFAQRAGQAPGTVMLSPEDMPAGPQETTATVGKSLLAGVHQWGLVVVPQQAKWSGHPQFSLQLPTFVHTTTTAAAGPAPRLEFSALYIHPPLRLASPLKFDVTMQVVAGIVDGWYPYAAAMDYRRPNGREMPGSSVDWRGVLAGGQADGLMTTNPVWMAARAVEAPATLKVYKPGPAGAKPDDLGTTEGEVFLFLRGQIWSEMLKADAMGSRVRVRARTAGAREAADKGSSAGAELEMHGWQIRVGSAAGGAEYCVRDVASEGASDYLDFAVDGGLEPGPEGAALSRDEIAGQWNVALVGRGLAPDEAAAMSRVTLAAMDRAGRYVFVLLPKEWADAALPLQVEGAPTQPVVRVFGALFALP